MHWEEAAVSRWLEPVASREGEWAEVFAESLRETSLWWRDGAIADLAVRREEGVAARWRFGREESFVHVPGNDETAVREAVRLLRQTAGKAALPIRTPHANPPEDEAGARPELEPWIRRLTGAFARHAPRHRFRFRLRTTQRRIVSPGRPSASSIRRLVSVEGRFTAASRLGDEVRGFAFHAPDSEATADELRLALSAAALPRGRPAPTPEGELDVVLAGGSAAVLFHEILSHPLESGVAGSPLDALAGARIAVADLEVSDDPKRLDLFGGYEHDDEGTVPRMVRLAHSGVLAGRLSDRAHAGPAGSTGHGRRAGPTEPPLPRGSNVVVAPGSATPEELTRRLADGLWIEEIRGGSVDLAAGTFRLHFPRARRVRRGAFADELGPGWIAGAFLDALRHIEPVLGRQAHVYRALGWCARAGQVVPVGGAAPDVLIRRLPVRAGL